MCKCVHDDGFDCRGRCKTEPTKFEVGKKYRWRDTSNSLWFDCLFVAPNGAAVMYTDSKACFLAMDRELYIEYVEPPKLYFKDLKPGDKFKWVRCRGCSKDAVCVKYDTTVGNGNGAISPSSIGLWAYLGEHTLGSANLSTDSPEREKELTEVIHVE